MLMVNVLIKGQNYAIDLNEIYSWTKLMQNQNYRVQCVEIEKTETSMTLPRTTAVWNLPIIEHAKKLP